MKAAITDGKGRLWIEDVPRPEPGPWQCLCRIDACATCTGTDQKHITGTLPFPNEYPGILGHESVGTVIAAGPRVRYVREGMRVLRPCAVFPGERLGEWFSVWGGFAEYGLVLDRAAWIEDHPGEEAPHYSRFQQEIPADLGLTAADATMLVTLKEAASFTASVGVGLFRSAAVLGAGAVGLSMIRFAKLYGAFPVIAVARREAPLAHALRLGADAAIRSDREDVPARIRELTEGRGADRIIDTTGDAAFLRDALPGLAESGKAAPYATYAGPDAVSQAVPAAQRIEAGPQEDAAHPWLASALRFGLVRPADFYSHRMPLDRIVEGFEMLRNRKALKIVFEMAG